jgi:hypothetical protein
MPRHGIQRRADLVTTGAAAIDRAFGATATGGSIRPSGAAGPFSPF